VDIKTSTYFLERQAKEKIEQGKDAQVDFSKATKALFSIAKPNFEENLKILPKMETIHELRCMTGADILFIGSGPSAERKKEPLKKLYNQGFWVTFNCSSSWAWCQENDIICDYTLHLDYRYTDIFQGFKGKKSMEGQTWVCYGGTHPDTVRGILDCGADVLIYDVNYEKEFQLDPDGKYGLIKTGLGINVANACLGLSSGFRANSWSSIGDERCWEYTSDDAGIKGMYSKDNELYEAKKDRVEDKIMWLNEEHKYVTSVDLYNSRTWLYNNYVAKRHPADDLKLFDLSGMNIPGVEYIELSDMYNSYINLKEEEDTRSKIARKNSKKRRKKRKKRKKRGKK